MLINWVQTFYSLAQYEVQIFAYGPGIRKTGSIWNGKDRPRWKVGHTFEQFLDLSLSNMLEINTHSRLMSNVLTPCVAAFANALLTLNHRAPCGSGGTGPRGGTLCGEGRQWRRGGVHSKWSVCWMMDWKRQTLETGSVLTDRFFG